MDVYTSFFLVKKYFSILWHYIWFKTNKRSILMKKIFYCRFWMIKMSQKYPLFGLFLNKSIHMTTRRKRKFCKFCIKMSLGVGFDCLNRDVTLGCFFGMQCDRFIINMCNDTPIPWFEPYNIENYLIVPYTYAVKVR